MFQIPSNIPKSILYPKIHPTSQIYHTSQGPSHITNPSHIPRSIPHPKFIPNPNIHPKPITVHIPFPSHNSRGWLQQCRAEHSKSDCRLSTKPKLPTRILDISYEAPSL